MISLYYHADDIKSILLAQYKLSNLAQRGHTLTQGMTCIMEKATQETRSDCTNQFLFQFLVWTCIVWQTPGNQILL